MQAYIIPTECNTVMRTGCCLCGKSMHTTMFYTLVYSEPAVPAFEERRRNTCDVCDGCAMNPPDGIEAPTQDELGVLWEEAEVLSRAEGADLAAARERYRGRTRPMMQGILDSARRELATA